MAKRASSNSRRFVQLSSRLKYLQKNILPKPNLVGNYSPLEKDFIRSFVALSHAEIESYFEDITKKKITDCYSAWQSKRKPSNSLKALLAFTSRELNLDKASETDVEIRIQKTFNFFISDTLKNNNGIKSKNILSLLLPLGIECSEIDQAWLAEMDYYGGIRGNIVHNTFSVAITPNPTDIINKLNNTILPEIKKIDSVIKKLE